MHPAPAPFLLPVDSSANGCYKRSRAQTACEWPFFCGDRLGGRRALKIKWYPPLDKLFGPVSELDLARPAPVAEVLRRLAEREPGFATYARFDPADVRPPALLVWRKGEVLNLADEVEPGDDVEMLLMVTGG